jgi:hypothetical protein
VLKWNSTQGVLLDLVVGVLKWYSVGAEEDCRGHSGGVRECTQARVHADGRTHSETHAFARMQKHIDMHTHTPM